jgi:membrane protein YdbS with pleckstrin-like domain
MPKPTILAARGAGLLLLLSLVLALLKQAGLTRVAHWSWWVITSPLWSIWVFMVVLALLGVVWALLVVALRRSARP